MPEGGGNYPFCAVAFYGTAKLFTGCNTYSAVTDIVFSVIHNNRRQNKTFSPTVKSAEILIEFKGFKVRHITSPFQKTLNKLKGHLILSGLYEYKLKS